MTNQTTLCAPGTPLRGQVTLADIRAAAEYLAARHNDTTACAAIMQAEIKTLIAPVLEKYKATLDAYAASEAAAHAALTELLVSAPHLFVKPRSLAVDGVKAGYRKAEDTLDWDDDEVVARRIGALFPAQYDLLVRTQVSLVVDAVAALDAENLRRIGVRTVTGADSHFITVGDNDAEKLTKLVIAAAAARQGDDDKPRAAKGKAKAGKAVAA
jgi:hypothetical protein